MENTMDAKKIKAVINLYNEFMSLNATQKQKAITGIGQFNKKLAEALKQIAQEAGDHE